MTLPIHPCFSEYNDITFSSLFFFLSFGLRLRKNLQTHQPQRPITAQAKTVKKRNCCTIEKCFNCDWKKLSLNYNWSKHCSFCHDWSKNVILLKSMFDQPRLIFGNQLLTKPSDKLWIEMPF